MNIVAVIPAYNEGGRVGKAVQDALAFASYAVVVDDCSTDQTVKEAREAGAIVLEHVINRGQGASLQTGTCYALEVLKAETIIHFDADGQMSASEIPSLVLPIQRNEIDVALGSRFLARSSRVPFVRRLVLKLGIYFTFFLSGIYLTDTHNGFRALSKDAASKIVITLDRMAHASQILDQIKHLGLRFKEMPVTITYSVETLRKGQSSFGAIRILKDIIKGKFFDL